MKKLIVGNWKLNPGSVKDAVKLASKINRKAKNTVVICPPAVYLSVVNYPSLGAQDAFWQDRGAFTGQVSPVQLKNLKVKYCIVGHSEKRAAGETNEQVALKLKALIAQKITPILCIGFGATAEEDDLAVVDMLKSQLQGSLKGVQSEKVIVAYEPVWAIGTGKTASPEHAEKIALFIKTRFNVTKVLYGGSVNTVNAPGFLAQRNVDGLLVGGESLIADHFNTIINY